MKYRKPAPLSTRQPKSVACVGGDAVAAQPFSSNSVVLPFEDPAAFESMRNAFLEQFRPATAMEMLLIDDIAASRWRMLRVIGMQTAYTNAQLEKSSAGNPLLALESIMNTPTMRLLMKMEATERRAYESAWRKLTALQKERKKEERRPSAAAQAASQPAAEPAERSWPSVQNEPTPPPLTSARNGHHSHASVAGQYPGDVRV